MNEVEYERQQERAWLGKTMAEHLQALLSYESAEDFARLNHDLYKYTASGAHICLRLWGGEPVWSHDKRLSTINPGDVESIGVGTIVEGTDMAPETRWLDLIDYAEDENADRLIRDWGNAVTAIEIEAHVIWLQTHGCDDCGTDDGSVNPDCQSCNGDGVII